MVQPRYPQIESPINIAISFMILLKKLSVLTAISSASFGLLASPTSNEFKSCNKLAVKYLETCLDKNINSKANGCWKTAETQFKQCVAKVKNSHNSSLRKEREKEEKLKLQKKSNKPPNSSVKL